MTLTQQLKKDLLQMIQTHGSKPGDQFPPELELCNRFKVSRYTMREAIRELVQEGYLYRIQGKGTFIAHMKIHVSAHKKNNFRTIAQESGFSPGIRFLSIEPHPWEEMERIASKLNLVEGEIWCIGLVRSVNSIPLVYSRSYLPKDRFPDLERLLEDNKDLYELLNEHYAIGGIVKEPYTLEVDLPRPNEMHALKISASLPVFIVKSRSRNGSAAIVDYRVSISRSDMIKWTNLKFEYENQLA
jgi:GntR family transcriptional regulator